MSTFVEKVEFVTEECCNCHMQFAMSADFYRQRRNDYKTFFCPAGHSQQYTGPTEETRLKRELERREQMLEAERARAARLEDEKAAVQRAHSRMRARVINGVCPCCNRTFQNLMRHMQTEHAEEFTLKHLRTAFGLTQTAVAQEIGIPPAYVSNHEGGKYVPEYAEERIQQWIDRQAPEPSAPPANQYGAIRMSEHHRVTEEGKQLGALTSNMHDKGRQILASNGLSNIDLPTCRSEMCASCACRPGTVPNGCAQTQLDLIKAVVDGKPFLCHAPMDGKMCAGWLAVRAFHAHFPAQPLIDMANSWEYSPPDNVKDTHDHP